MTLPAVRHSPPTSGLKVKAAERLCLLYAFQEQIRTFPPEVKIVLQDTECYRLLLNAAYAELLSTAASDCKDMWCEHIQLLLDRELAEYGTKLME